MVPKEDEEEAKYDLASLEEVGRPSRQPSRKKSRRHDANVLFHPDGRIQLNTDVMGWVWKDNPAGENEEAGPAAIKLYVSEKQGRKTLIITAASSDDPNAYVATPVGRREIRWPVVCVTRAARLVRDRLGIYGKVRFPARQVQVRAGGETIDAVEVDLSHPIEGSTDDLERCLRKWKESVSPGEAVDRKTFLRQLAEIAAKLGTVITRREVEQYFRLRREELRRLGIDVTPSGKVTFKNVRVVR